MKFNLRMIYVLLSVVLPAIFWGLVIPAQPLSLLLSSITTAVLLMALYEVF